jgi:hypothetical protein
MYGTWSELIPPVEGIRKSTFPTALNWYAMLAVTLFCAATFTVCR